ncbi:SMI1/KNR4 family protein [Xenorhabdus innexi]|uniref:Knr4/Smi1-like domain-containing protein n=1 Tax=Xenorhabdus innexi TaxID=290109 RepID=A0A1N6N1E9_9GAMM|nr:SMI1/KNR4 family protein [Xenorhabdus innexi]PHM37014.1 hypothetical protein Xinn_01285 [Xenorhabdus innexi]SIP74928.1 Predicted protein [Xenorhabdus innexi]
MHESIEKIEILKGKSKHIKTYPNFDKSIILKNMGKIPGEVDKEHLEFLMLTNGVSILDYCFPGLKNNQLGVNVYELMMELWQKDNLLTLRFWGIAGTSTSEYFGYLDKKNDTGGHYIGYYSSNEPEKVHLVSSSFSIFMYKFLFQINRVIENNINALGIDDNSWFLDIKNLIKLDVEMERYISSVNNNTEYLSTIYK